MANGIPDTAYDETMREFASLQTYRAQFASQWEEAAELVLPTSRNTFFYGSYNFPGQKKTDRQVDAHAMLALWRFAAILDSLLTPRNMTWHMLGSNSDYLMKQRAVRLWFEQATKILFKYRYAPIANFSAQNYSVFESLGAFGNGIMFADRAADEAGRPVNGIRYKNIPLGEIFLRENHQNLINGFIRWFRLTGPQAVDQFKEKCPPRLREAADKNSQAPFEFLHRVCPREDYDPRRLDVKGKRFASYYISLTTGEMISEGGYTTFPVAASRYVQTPGEVYGRGPVQFTLPSIKTVNSEKRDFLTQGHRAASPVLLTQDDGIASFNLRPGAINPGFMNADGKMMVGVLPSGNIQVTQEMMKEEHDIIDGAFLVDLFKILLDDPKIYTATQIVEMMSQRGVLIAPTVGRQEDEYLGRLIDREIDLLSQQHLLPPMPMALREARGEYEVHYCSPFSRDMKASEVAGFNRSLETSLSIVNATQDPSVLDLYDFDKITPAINRINGVPESWMADPKSVAQKRQARAQAQQKQQEIQAMPAQAAMMKAKAAGGVPPQQQVQQPLPAPNPGPAQ